MYDPIYSANVGLCGFRCGIKMHCWRVHGLTAQMEMNYEAKTDASEYVRGERGKELRGDFLFVSGPAKDE